jgi:hypothetical protein
VAFGNGIEKGTIDRLAAAFGGNSQLHISDLAKWSVGHLNFFR